MPRTNGSPAVLSEPASLVEECLALVRDGSGDGREVGECQGERGRRARLARARNRLLHERGNLFAEPAREVAGPVEGARAWRSAPVMTAERGHHPMRLYERAPRVPEEDECVSLYVSVKRSARGRATMKEQRGSLSWSASSRSRNRRCSRRTKFGCASSPKARKWSAGDAGPRRRPTFTEPFTRELTDRLQHLVAAFVLAEKASLSSSEPSVSIFAPHAASPPRA